jgi:predicted acyl esterase
MAVSGKAWPGYAKGTIPDEGFEWKWIDATPPDILNRDPATGYIPLGYSKEILPKGWKKTPENKALDLDIIFEKDVEVTMRDGVKVRLVSLDC